MQKKHLGFYPKNEGKTTKHIQSHTTNRKNSTAVDSRQLRRKYVGCKPI